MRDGAIGNEARARVIIGLALVFDAAVWVLVIWAPVVWLALSWNRVLFAVAGCLACGVAAVSSRFVERGIWCGHRWASVLVCLLLTALAGYHVWQASVTTSATAILAISRAAVYVCLAVLTASLIKRPDASLAALRSQTPPRNMDLRRAVSLWCVCGLVSIAVTFLAYASYGFTRANVIGHLSTVVVQYVALLAWVWALHRVLRLYRIPSVFSDTFCLFTTVAVPVAPFVTLVALPGVQRALEVRAAIESIGIRDLLREGWLIASTLDDERITQFIAVLHPVVVLAGLIVLATFVVRAGEHYGADKRRTAHATGFGLAVGLPLVVTPLLILQYALLMS